MTFASATIHAKAERLLAEGRVTQRANREQFDVTGDTSTHVVTIPNQDTTKPGSCTRCKANEYGRQCSHITAAKLLLHRSQNETPDDERL